MKNPNIKVSQDKIVLKSISKEISGPFLQNFLREILESTGKYKDLNKKKVVKNINVLKDNKANENTGTAFVHFLEEQMAVDFMEKISEEKNWQKLVNSKKERPIIEYCFCDQLKERKRQQVLEKVKAIQSKKDDILEENPVPKKKKIEKQKYEQSKVEAKKLVNDALQKNSVELAKEVLEQLEGLKSRGIKRRLRNKLLKKFKELDQQ